MFVQLDDVRQDLLLAHEQAIAALSRPGTWWTGAQRRELALTAQLAINETDPVAPWVGVSTLANKLPVGLTAPKIAHDAIYRITRHAATLTRESARLFSVRPISKRVRSVVCTTSQLIRD